MAVHLLAYEVADLCLGKPPLKSLSWSMSFATSAKTKTSLLLPLLSNPLFLSCSPNFLVLSGTSNPLAVRSEFSGKAFSSELSEAVWVLLGGSRAVTCIRVYAEGKLGKPSFQT
ncbi:uncharacterized protein LOC114313260 [Camellia sinensis]|uniref:uncharacterized protein LOC114313260 n=1 Tax=Camellia sinensis TaxID=4442 RepID=UPI0010368912|nr:uncharacterized protein LOC114313260 [Camellia sinensis]